MMGNHEKQEVVVCESQSPSDFHIQLKTDLQELSKLQNDLNHVYCQQWTKTLRLVENPSTGIMCVAFDLQDHLWYRAKIIHIKPIAVQVLYVDYGRVGEVVISDIRQIVSPFIQVPPFAIKCTLSEVSSSCYSDNWSSSVIFWFNKCVLNKTFHAVFTFEETNSDDEPKKVLLFFPGSKKSIQQLMVTAGLGISTLDGVNAESSEFEEAHIDSSSCSEISCLHKNDGIEMTLRTEAIDVHEVTRPTTHIGRLEELSLSSCAVFEAMSKSMQERKVYALENTCETQRAGLQEDYWDLDSDEFYERKKNRLAQHYNVTSKRITTQRPCDQNLSSNSSQKRNKRKTIKSTKVAAKADILKFGQKLSKEEMNEIMAKNRSLKPNDNTTQELNGQESAKTVGKSRLTLDKPFLENISKIIQSNVMSCPKISKNERHPVKSKVNKSENCDDNMAATGTKISSNEPEKHELPEIEKPKIENSTNPNVPEMEYMDISTKPVPDTSSLVLQTQVKHPEINASTQLQNSGKDSEIITETKSNENFKRSEENSLNSNKENKKHSSNFTQHSTDTLKSLMQRCCGKSQLANDTVLKQSPKTPESSIFQCDTGGKSPNRRETGDNNRNELFKVVISDVESPSHFHVQIKQNISVLNDLQDDMNSFYSKAIGNKSLIFPELPLEGTVCVSLFVDNLWYRAKIIKAVNKDYVVVQYVDYGNTYKVHREHLRHIHCKYIDLPCQAVLCSLFGIKSAGNKVVDKGGWSEFTLAWFDDVTQGKEFVAHFHKSKMNEMPRKEGVSLYRVDAKQIDQSLQNMADILVDLGHADSTQETSSQIISQNCSDNKDIQTSPNSHGNEKNDQREKDESYEFVFTEEDIETSVSSREVDCSGGVESTCSIGSLHDEESGRNVEPEKCEHDLQQEDEPTAKQLQRKSDGLIKVEICSFQNPHAFHLQIQADITSLNQLQKEMNAFYAQPWTERLQFKEPTIEGTVCVALCGNTWYRAQILETLSGDQLKIELKDYGDTSVVSVDAVCPISPQFLAPPPYAVPCWLDGIQPTSKGWDSIDNLLGISCTAWFIQQSANHEFFAEFLSTDVPCHVNLFISSSDQNGNSNLWNVSDILHLLGMVAWNNQTDPTTQLDTIEPDVSNHSTTESSPQDDHSAADKPLLDHWNPMADEYHSNRNNYATNTDDPCMVVENVDTRVKVCKYHWKGDCWKGRNCPLQHVPRNVLPSAWEPREVFSYQSIPSEKLRPNTYALVQVTTLLTTGDFYISILQSPTLSLNTDVSLVPKKLEQLSHDMKQYYSKNRKRFAPVVSPSCGEMFTIIHELCFSRAAVVKVATAMPRVKVYLIDRGVTLWVNKSQLIPFNVAFMHLPAQAILCTNISEQSNIKQVNKLDSIAIKVWETENIVDGPTPITVLFKLTQSARL